MDGLHFAKKAHSVMRVRARLTRLAAACALGAALPLAIAAPLPGELGEVLDPDKAFRISARTLGGKRVEVKFNIAEGYYLYRNRFSFATESGKSLAEVEIPRGKVKEDPFFGNTETFRHLVRIRMAVSDRESASGSVKLKVTSQGCADAGVCYAPHQQVVEVKLPAAAPKRGNR